MSGARKADDVKITKEVIVVNKLGIHARPAAMFVKAANRLECDIFVEKDGEKSPDFRISAGAMDIGAAWKKTSREGRDYISVKLDDPSFPAPVYATLSETDTAGEYALIWSR